MIYNPGVTYRVQFRKEFTFVDFEKITTYLAKLGVSTIYASPVFCAVPGSAHGYDVTDANSINPEIGTLQELYNLTNGLRLRGIGWMQDIVPNHMAYHGQNGWLMDVLKNGKESPYAQWFDIDWNHPEFDGRIMLPVLGTTLQQAIDEKAIQVVSARGGPALQHDGVLYPIDKRSIPVAEENTGNWIEKINRDPEKLSELLALQHYRFCPWREASGTINYRRFFTINGMICLNMQDKKVLDFSHALVQKLASEKVIDALRVDHIDGLFDPTEYLFALRQLVGHDTYIAVEKILEPKEQLPEYWPVQGTTGYDFIAEVNNLFTANDGMSKLQRFYHELGHEHYHAELVKKKKLILSRYMQGELDNLYRLMQTTIPQPEDLSAEKMKRAIALFLVYCPVYRYYSNSYPLDDEEQKKIKHLFERTKEHEPDYSRETEYLEHLFTDENKSKYANEIAILFKRLMQFTGPLMAKGVEDTLMYTYTENLGHNEVGDTPKPAASTIADFHSAMVERQRLWPVTMNATATHDTKRGEDARTRLHAISHSPDAWTEAVKYWKDLNSEYKQRGAPTDQDEYFIYQALTASYPMPGQDMDDFGDRIKAYLLKALKEAKTNTSWDEPNEMYEAAVISFVEHILKPDNAFMASFMPLHKQIADAGIVISLSQVILKCTCPGMPDVYQGCELWDLSMVDPDNRRPVDYPKREQWLYELAGNKDIAQLWQERYSGKIKLWLLHELLTIRKYDKELFRQANYVPLTTSGKYRDCIIAYARIHKNKWYVIVATVAATAITNWEDTNVTLPDNDPASVMSILTGESIEAGNPLMANTIFSHLPFAILSGTVKENKRSAGVLLPVFSLPGDFGIGDMGQNAAAFIDALQQSRQKYWQLLPLNPANANSSYSPYSSQSAMACNPLLVSPELLANDGLLHADELKEYHIKNSGRVDYGHAEHVKINLLDQAYQTYCRKNFMSLRYGFREYCQRENYWLRDFALFMALKRQYNESAWYDWPQEYKLREPNAMIRFAKAHAAELEKTKWIQFITDRQWMQLRAYCNQKGIKIFGDLPFYVSYDSEDVWANPEIFMLDVDGKMTGVAGVPPDYFSEDGQLWGVPTFNWQKIRERKYAWWIKRMKRNIELFDLVRIDHFRALASYWEVAAGERTARNGRWKKGPGMEFFYMLKKKLPELPLVAEDLGYEMDDVYALRDESGLPGMKVLQFAWGDNIGKSVDIPHNYPLNCIAYTGTHDNNTTIGWYKNETSEADRDRMREYTGREINDHNISDVMCKMVYGSVAYVAILPMQDILALDRQFRMNTPGTATGNWQWRLTEAIMPQTAAYLAKLVKLYNRD